MGHKIRRRSFLKAGALALGACAFPQALLGAFQAPLSPERSLSFYNLHTGESLKAAYWCKGEYLSAPLAQINHILRDFRTGEIKPIDTSLLDLLSTIRENLGSQEMFHIISGYRHLFTGGVQGYNPACHAPACKYNGTKIITPKSPKKNLRPGKSVRHNSQASSVPIGTLIAHVAPDRSNVFQRRESVRAST